jgi:cell division protein FtsW
MARKLKSDKLLFLPAFLLLGGGVVMVYSASAVIASERYNLPASYFLFKQVTWAVLGVALLGLMMRIDYRHYRQPVVIWTAVGLAAAGLVGVFLSPPVNGAQRWFGIGGIGVQPSELAKLAAVIFTAAILERRMDRIGDVKYALLPIGVVAVGFAALIVRQPDLGTAVALLLIVGTIVFAAGLPYRYLAGVAMVSLPALAILLWRTEYRRRRLLAFLDPWQDQFGHGFQPVQSIIAVGTGGILGRGLMEGVQKAFFLPEPHTDFIYSVIAEESGLVGATAVLACFCLITWRGLRAAVRAPDRFGALLAIGLTTMVAVQAFINISVALSLMPTKGIPMPFVSYGGSSLLVNLISLGILLNISQHASPVPRAPAVVPAEA